MPKSHYNQTDAAAIVWLLQESSWCMPHEISWQNWNKKWIITLYDKVVARLREVVVVYGKNQLNTPIVTWQSWTKCTRAMRHVSIYNSRRKKSHFSLSVLIFLRYEWPWEIFVSQTNGRFLISHWKNSLNILTTKLSRFLFALTTELRELSGRYLVKTEWRWPKTNASSSVGLTWIKK